MNLKIYIIAGEPSGDLHGAHLVQAFHQSDPKIEFRGFGGPKMARAGVSLDQNIDRLSFMGFAEIIGHLPQIFSNFTLAKKSIQSWQPDAIIYVDFPGFNMRMAKWAHRNGFKNFYYIAPQAWAWKANRAKVLKKYIDDLFCILPFEKEFFSRYAIDAHYVGHPLVDIIREFKEHHQPLAEKKKGKVLALLPGSRPQEVQKILPVQLEASLALPGYEVVIAQSPNVPEKLYHHILERTKTSPLMEKDAYALLKRADVACVASGTATLETALFRVPQVVCFKGNPLTYHIAKRLIKVPYIALVNLIMEDKIVSELIQSELTAENLTAEMQKLDHPDTYNKIIHSYEKLEDKLGLGGAATKTAKIILSRLPISKYL